MPGRHRLLSGTLLVTGVLTLAAGLAYRYALPAVAESMARTALRDLGLPDAGFTLARLDFSGATLTGVRLDAGERLTAARVRVDLDGLAIDTVTISGLRFSVRYADGRFDLGPIDTLLARKGEGGGAGRAPLRRVVLKDARVTLDAFGETREVAVEGSVDFPPSGRLEPQIRASGSGLVEFRLWGEVDPKDGAGRVNASVRYDLARFRLGPVRVAEGIVVGTLTVDDFRRVEEVGLRILADPVSIGEFEARAVEVWLEGTGGALAAELGAKIDDLLVHVRRVKVPAEPLRWFDGPRRLEGDFRAHGTPPRALLPSPLAVAEVEASGRLLADLRAERVSIPEATVEFSGAAVSPFVDGVGSLRVSGEGGTDRVVVRVLAGSAVKAFHPGERLSVEAVVDEEARIDWSSAESFRAAAPVMRATAAVDGIYGALESVRIARPRASLVLRAEAGPSGVTAEALPGSFLFCEGAFLGDEANGLHLSAARFAPKALSISVAGDPARARIAADLEAAEALRLEGPVVTAKVTRLAWSGEAVVGPGAPPQVAGRAAATFSQALFPRSEILLSEVRADLDLSISASNIAAGPGTVEMGAFSIGKRRLPGLTLAVAPTADGVSYESKWTLTPDAVVALTGAARLFTGPFTSETSLSMPSFKVKEDDLLGRLLARELSATISGAFALSGRYRADATGATGALDVRAVDGKVSIGEGTFTAEGVTGMVRLLGPDRLASDGEGQAAFRTAKLGDFELTSGSCRFTLGERVGVSALAWRMGKTGRFSTDAFSFDAKAPDIRTTVRIADWALEDWLGLISGEKVRGEGVVSGSLPLRVRPKPQLLVEVGKGKLSATGTGVIMVGDQERVREILSSGLPRDEYGKLVTDRVVQSLLDFAFDTLTFDFVERGGGLTLSVKTKGRGRKVSQELDLTVNLNGVDQVLRDVLAVKLGLDRAKGRLGQ